MKRAPDMLSARSRRVLSALFAAAFFLSLLGFTAEADAQRRGGERGRNRDGSGEKEKKVESGDLASIAKLGKGVRDNDGFFDLVYTYRDEKGRRKSQKAFVQIDDETPLYLDRRVKIEAMEAGQKIWILGRVVEREVRDGPGGGGGGRGGLGGGGGGGGVPGQSRGTDRQIQNAKVVLAGEQLSVNHSYKDRKDKAVKWIQATVSSSTAGLRVKYDGNEFRVTFARGAPVLVRSKATEKERKILKKVKYVHIVGDESTDRPSTKKKTDEDKPSYETRRLIVLDPRLVSTIYPLLLFPR